MFSASVLKFSRDPYRRELHKPGPCLQEVYNQRQAEARNEHCRVIYPFKLSDQANSECAGQHFGMQIQIMTLTQVD